MNWELVNGDVWACYHAGVPIAFAKRLNAKLWTYMAISPDGVIANAQLENHTAFKTILDCEQTLRDLGWNL